MLSNIVLYQFVMRVICEEFMMIVNV